MIIGIIGGGNMGGAIYRALKNVFPKKNLLITDRHPKKLKTLGARETKLEMLIKNADVIILAVKPQTFGEFCATLPAPLKGKLVISILAGIPLKRLQKETGATAVVRTMPNLPAQVGVGVTEWIAGKNCTNTQKRLVQKILSTFGTEVEVARESLIGELSTISGCGPAYFFYLTELLTNQAKRFGLSPAEAEMIAKQTFVGTAKLLSADTRTPAQWRAGVTSKGGVTEAVLKHLAKKKFDAIFYAAIAAGKKRSDELSK